MAADQVEVMRALGFERFAVVGHDRGGRVAHRMALDHPDAVERIAVLDIAPTATMYARTDKAFATAVFLVVLPDPARAPAGAADRGRPGVLPAHAHRGPEQDAGLARSEALFRSTCAATSIPRRATPSARTTAPRRRSTSSTTRPMRTARITAPLLALWGAKGTVGQLYDVLETWREKALDVRGPGARLRAHAAGGGAGGNLARAIGLPNLSEKRVVLWCCAELGTCRGDQHRLIYLEINSHKVYYGTLSRS